MRKLTILSWLLLLAVACNPIRSDETDVSPVIDDNQSEDSLVQDSPRVEAELPPTATTLPPTWTPVPLEHSGHLPAGADMAPILGTRIIHVVQRGDTLAKISHRYGASIADVASINNISDWDHIEVGQVLTIPVSGN